MVQKIFVFEANLFWLHETFLFLCLLHYCVSEHLQLVANCWIVVFHQCSSVLSPFSVAILLMVIQVIFDNLFGLFMKFATISVYSLFLILFYFSLLWLN